MAKAVPSLTHLFSKDKVCVFIICVAIFAFKRTSTQLELEP